VEQVLDVHRPWAFFFRLHQAFLRRFLPAVGAALEGVFRGSFRPSPEACDSPSLPGGSQSHPGWVA
jgi:hypothetical protein